MCAVCVREARNQERAVPWATWLKTEFRGHPVHPQPPTFCGFQALNGPRRRVDPRTSCHLVQSEGSLARARLGPTVGPPWSMERKKKFFFQADPRPLGMLKQVFVGRFEPVVAHFGPWKIPKYLENGPFQDQKWVKNGSKTHCAKSDPGPFGVLKQVFLAHFEPETTRFGPWKRPKCLENGPLWDQKWVKNRSKMCFFQK